MSYYSKKLFRHPAQRDAAAARVKLTGGTPIDAETAIELRRVIFGSAAAPPRGEWTRTPLAFTAAREVRATFRRIVVVEPNMKANHNKLRAIHSQDLAYGLRSPRNGTRGLQSVLQAFVLKHLVFDQRPRDQKSVPIDQLLHPTEAQQCGALLSAMADILWTIGERSQVCIVLPGEVAHFGHSVAYYLDGVTEKLMVFRCASLEDVQIQLKRYLHYFTDPAGAGALIFLYCAVMTRTPEKVLTDLDAPKGAYLMGPNEEGSLNVVTLLLTGRATPYLHNGVVYVGDEDHYALPQFGVLSRATVGMLVLGTDAEIAFMQSSKNPGSRLKTPALPIWVTCCSNHFGVLFNSNRELLRNYHAEKRFELHYYTCAGCYLAMTVDNCARDDQMDAAAPTEAMTFGFGQLERSSAGSPSQSRGGGSSSTTATVPATTSQQSGGAAGATAGSSKDSGAPPTLERLIHTKWAEAKITFKGPTPASLSF